MSTTVSPDAPDRLNELIDSVPDLSAPSVTKFDQLRNWLASVLGLTPNSIVIYFVSKPGNLDVRFKQPGSISSPKRIGVALLEDEGHLEACINPAKRFVSPWGHIDCMAICVRPIEGKWSIARIFAPEGSSIASSLRSHFPGSILDELPAQTVAAATRSPAGALSAVPLITDPRIKRMIRLAIASAPAVMLVGPPGTGKTTLLEEIIEEVRSDPSDFGFSREPSAKWVTAEESWTTRDLVGGETLDEKSRIRFRPGHVLDAIREDKWLVLDEANRADMDKIFGGLLTWLAGHEVELGRASTDVAAPPVILGWNDSSESKVNGDDRLACDTVGTEVIRFLAGREWRLLGTYNALDAQRVFRFGQALGRRFVRVPVPAMSVDEFRQALQNQLVGLPPSLGEGIVGIYAAHRESNVAVLGSALFFWIPVYVRKGLELPNLLDEPSTPSAPTTDAPAPSLEETRVRSLLTEAYLSSAGVWLSRLDETEIMILRSKIAPIITDQEWEWLASLLPLLG
jgi:hypothetical protein